jgi:FHS family glucose/mannose:H+ symporter-like MFS transporter
MTAPQPAPGLPGAARVPDHGLRAGLVAGAAYTLVGWRALLVPSLILFVAPAFGQADAGMGAYYLVTALAYGVGALFGGRFIRRFGARLILPSAAALMAVGLLIQGFTGAWIVFALAGVFTSIGASSTDVGIQALVLDLFPHARSRALNLLHVAYGVGALMAPLLLAGLVGAGVPWQWLMTGSGIAMAVAGVALALTVPPDPVLHASTADVDAARAVETAARSRRLPLFLLVMAVSITCYVAAEAGVSDWLVRYLAALPLTQASLALTLFWGGIAVGRLAFARIGNRLDAQRSAAVLAVAGGAMLTVALVLPVSALSPLLFGAVGLAFGPIFPLMVAAAGTRLPGESATVTGTLVFAAVVGVVIYPPAIGFLSDVIGLQAAMMGTAVMAFACGIAAWTAIRVRT